MKYSENQIKQLRQDSLKFVNGALSTAKAWNKQFQENVEAAGEPKKSRIKPKVRAILNSAIGIVLKVLGMVFLKIEPEFMHFDESPLSREKEYETPIDIYRKAMRIHERVTNVLAEKLKTIRDGINDDEYLIRFYEGCIDVITQKQIRENEDFFLFFALFEKLGLEDPKAEQTDLQYSWSSKLLFRERIKQIESNLAKCET